jgi:hypothetical protein
MLHILVDKEKQKQQKTLYLAAIIADCININDFNYHVFGYMTDDVCSFLRTLKSQILSQEKRESLKRWLNSIQGANAEEILEAITR